MIRNLKVMGLALVALFALSAMTASAASATGKLTTSDGTAKTLIGTQTGAFGSGSNAFTMFGEEKIECKKVTLTGHEITTTPHKPVPNGATKITATFHYSECFAFPGELPATVDMNGCDFDLTIGQTTAIQVHPHEYLALATTTCPAGKNVQVTVFSSSSHALRLCTITTTAPNELHGADWTHTTGKGDIDLVGTFTGYTAEKSGLCGSGTDNNANHDLDMTIEASDGTDITISH